MAIFTVDWQRLEESTIGEIGKNHFKFNPLYVCTKDGFNFEMDARMIMEIDDDLIIVNNFGSFPFFVDNVLSVLVVNFFTFKERKYVVSSLSRIQEEIINLSQKELVKYGVKITRFMIAYTEILPHYTARNEESKVTIKELHNVKNISDKKYGIICQFLGNIFFLLVLLSVAILMDIDDNVPIRLGPFISMIVIFISIYRYLEIRKIGQIETKEE